MPVPAIVIQPPTVPPSARHSLVDKVASRAVATLFRRRSATLVSIAHPPQSYRPPPPGRPRAHTASKVNVGMARDTSCSASSNTSGTAAAVAVALAAEARRRGRHTICGPPPPAPTLPPLQLGSSFSGGTELDAAELVTRLSFLDLQAIGNVLGRSMGSNSVDNGDEDKDETGDGDAGCETPKADSPLGTQTPRARLSSPRRTRPLTVVVPADEPQEGLQDEPEVLSRHSDGSRTVCPRSATASPSSPASPTILLTPVSDCAKLPPTPSRRSSVMSVYTIRRKPVRRNLFDMLDAEAYPHLINSIFDCMHPAQLQSLRKVSVDFRQWVDMYLSYKLTIETYAGVDESHISLGMSKFKRGAGRTFATRRFWSDEPIETLPVDAVPHSIIGRTRCLELRGPLSRTDVSHFAEGLFNLQTVRLSANGLGQFPDGCPFAPETVVATLHPDNVQDRQRASWEAGSRWQLPHGVKRLLINIRFDTLFSSGRVRPFAYPSSLKEINIRFVGHLPEKLLHSFMCVDGLDVILRHIGPLNCGIKYTFIDAVNFALLWDQPAPSALQRSVTSSSASPGATVLQATRRLASVVRRKKSTQSLDIEHVGHLASKHQQLVPHVVGGPMHAVNRHAAEAALMPSTPIYRTTPHIECCSLHEYVRRVGLDQFAMEAVDAAPMIL